MADIELVIKIPEELYNRFGHEYSNENLISKYTNDAILEAFCNGTPLPKGHGRLIDADEINHYMLPSEKQDKKTWFVHSEEYRNAVLHFNHAMELLRDNSPTIIEADKEQE